MTVKGLDARHQLAVVAAVDQHLRVVAHGLGQNRQWPGLILVIENSKIPFFEIHKKIIKTRSLS